MKQKYKQIAKHPYVFLLCLWYTLAWSWAFITDSLDLAGSKPVAMVIAVWVVVFNVALSVNIAVRTTRFLRRRFKKLHIWKVIFLGLPVFALMDFVISWVTAVIWLGPQGSIDNVLPLSSPALILINTPLGFASRLVGFYGLAGFFWLFVFLLIDKKRRAYSALILGILVILSFIGWIAYARVNGTELKATIISEDLDSRVGVIQDRDTSLVVFPEYGLDNIDNNNYQDRISKEQNMAKVYFLGSQQIMDSRPAGHLNVLLFGNSEQGITSTQEKSRLIPGGEDLGFIIRAALRATNQKDTLDYFSYAKMVNKGNYPLMPIKMDDSTILGSAVCSSIVAPKDYQTFASRGATIFTNSASLTIFKGSRVFAWQQKSLARFMAIANSRYFLQSANAATAYALDNNGKQIAEASGITATDVTVRNNSNKTLYSVVGEWVLASGFLVAFVWFAKLLYKRNKKIKSKKPHKKSKKSHNMIK